MTHNPHSGSCQGACCLKIQDLSVTFGTDAVLEHVNLHMHCGQIVALIGPNGAGKSTLIRAILGEKPYTGTITFSPAGGAPEKLRIGYVPQSPGFDPGDPISVLDLFACCLSRRPAFLPVGKAFRQRVLSCLARVHGEALLHKRVGTLSGGEVQRVLLALALEVVQGKGCGDPLPMALLGGGQQGRGAGAGQVVPVEGGQRLGHLGFPGQSVRGQGLAGADVLQQEPGVLPGGFLGVPGGWGKAPPLAGEGLHHRPLLPGGVLGDAGGLSPICIRTAQAQQLCPGKALLPGAHGLSTDSDRHSPAHPLGELRSQRNEFLCHRATSHSTIFL